MTSKLIYVRKKNNKTIEGRACSRQKIKNLQNKFYSPAYFIQNI